MPGEPECETKIETTIETPSNRSRHFEVYSRGIFWSGRRDSNPRPRAWEAPTLPTELRPLDVGVVIVHRSKLALVRGRFPQCAVRIALTSRTNGPLGLSKYAVAWSW